MESSVSEVMSFPLLKAFKLRLDCWKVLKRSDLLAIWRSVSALDVELNEMNLFMLNFGDSVIWGNDYDSVYFLGLFMNGNSKDRANGVASLFLCGRTSSYWKVEWQDEFNGRMSLRHLLQTAWGVKKVGLTKQREPRESSKASAGTPPPAALGVTGSWYHFMGRLALRKKSKIPNRLS